MNSPPTNIEKSGYTIDDGTTPSIAISRKIALGIIFSLIVLTAIGGNLLMCTAVLTDNRLKSNISNYFIVSLAVADFFVGSFVMTFAMIMDIQQRWMFGDALCRIWISCDIMCCTASIFNLSAISLDRYIQIQNPMFYDGWMTTCKVLMLIALIWTLSALTSFVAVNLGWRNTSVGTVYGNYSGENITSINDMCVLNVDVKYAIACSVMGFFAPSVVMLVLYFKLFLLARRHAENIRCTRQMIISLDQSSTFPTLEGKKKQNHATKWVSDYKAAFTLGVVMGVFLCCWLPFFVINSISFHAPGLIHENIFMVCTWLGYFNSCLNPFIYSTFNSEFRKAFKRTLSELTTERVLVLATTTPMAWQQ
ncbi:hypothetical protein RRG08_002337 [Elysia crispata]|uniref:G-protein coupled receptors family 1 profile domain-containing protein n=1 Tax=Elysia crispata TaxID=231223 RepID=A0AAE0ZBG6_9GAST|nr:hypothetical protein RRG08_002337 [Elysia crispata]